MRDMSWRDEVKECVVCGVEFKPFSTEGRALQKTRWRQRICCSRRCNAFNQHKVPWKPQETRAPKQQIHYILRFAAFVDKRSESDCWLWKGTIGSKGYGQFKLNGKKVAAHRMAYTLAYGPIPQGLLIRHTCDNPPCVNPNHLLVGTNADNVRDMMERGRHGSGKSYTSDLIEQILIEYVALPKGPKGKCSPGVSAAFLKKYDLPSQTLSNWLKEFSISF